MEYEYEVQGYYVKQYGWECLTTEENKADAERQLHCYNENEPSTEHRIRRMNREQHTE